MGNYSCCHPDNLPRQKSNLELVTSIRAQEQFFEPVDDLLNLGDGASRRDAELRKIVERLKSDSITETELAQTAYRAVMNFSQFHGIQPGSTDPLKCLEDTETANICQVVTSSAGLRGWAECNLPTVVVQLHAVGEDADGNAEIACFTIGGDPYIVRCASDWTVREFRSDLAEKLHVHVGSIRLTLPNAKLLSESHDDMQPFHLVRTASAQV
jgi:hypothetical protein